MLLRPFLPKSFPRSIRVSAAAPLVSTVSRGALFAPLSSTRFFSAAKPCLSARWKARPDSLPTYDMSASVEQITELLAKLPVSDLETFPNCFPNVNPVDVYRAHITTILHDLTGVDKAIIYPTLNWTSSLEKGDLIIAVPALRVKGKKPAELAQEIIEKFPESPLVEKPTAFDHFVQFFFKPGPLSKLVIQTIQEKNKEYGQNKVLGLRDPADPSKGPKRLAIDFSSPNIAKPFHAGHLRSTIIGGFLANLYEGIGWNVTRINYLGDWGKQYGLLAVGFRLFGNDEALEKDPINHLFEVYVKVNQLVEKEENEFKEREEKGEDVAELREQGVNEQARRYFKSMCDGEEDALSLWRRFRNLSITRYEATYKRLNIHFDDYSGESGVDIAAVDKIVDQLIEKGIAEESKGALIVDFAKHVPGKQGKSLEKTVIRKKDGTQLYLSRDMSEIIRRVEGLQLDLNYYVVASAQELHFRQLFKIAELLGYKEYAEKSKHINFGLVLGMSTRKGTVKFLDDILHDVGEYMHDLMRKNSEKYAQVTDPATTADILGISSVMVQDMSGKRINNYHFDMDQMTSFEGDTGPYLQYAHARLASIRRRAAEAGVTDEDLRQANWELLTEPHAVDVIRMIAQYPDVYGQALKTLEPTTILTYLFKITHSLSSSYDVLRVVGSEKDVMHARMALYDAAKTVLNNGMRLLGLTPVERM